MAIEIFPVPVTSTGPDAKTIVAATSDVLYQATESFPVGVYKVECPAGVVSNVEFLSSAGTVETFATTASGTVTVSVVTACDRIRAYTTSGTDTNITITLVSFPVADNMPAFGSLETLTNTQTYTGTSTSGYAYAVVVGGGGGGNGPNGAYGSGGGSGGVAKGIIALNGNLSVTIGTGGTGGTGVNSENTGTVANAGGATTVSGPGFTTITANGGGGGSRVYYSGGGSAGTPAGGNGSGAYGQGSGVSTPVYQFVKTGTTSGGGGSHGGSSHGNSSGGGGIGLGGSYNTGINGAGYGSGGGGSSSSNGGSGAPGVVYLKRF